MILGELEKQIQKHRPFTLVYPGEYDIDNEILGAVIQCEKVGSYQIVIDGGKLAGLLLAFRRLQALRKSPKDNQ